MRGGQVVRSDIVEATVAPITRAIQIHLDRRETFKFEVDVPFLVAVFFVKDACCDCSFLIAYIA